jgi:hypothetical protein
MWWPKEQRVRMKYWEIIADNLSKAGWSRGWVSVLDSSEANSDDDDLRKLGKVLMFFGNFVPKKPENKREGISPNYNNPHTGYALPGAKRFLSGSLGFLFFFYFPPEPSLNFLSDR